MRKLNYLGLAAALAAVGAPISHPRKAPAPGRRRVTKHRALGLPYGKQEPTTRQVRRAKLRRNALEKYASQYPGWALKPRRVRRTVARVVARGVWIAEDPYRRGV